MVSIVHSGAVLPPSVMVFFKQEGGRASLGCTREIREAAEFLFTGTLSISRARWGFADISLLRDTIDKYGYIKAELGN